MRIVAQRVREASVSVDDRVAAALLTLLSPS